MARLQRRKEGTAAARSGGKERRLRRIELLLREA